MAQIAARTDNDVCISQVSIDGSSELYAASTLWNTRSEVCRVVESYCVPNFDSPSVFARILDKNKVRGP
jgi:hypothetical protein